MKAEISTLTIIISAIVALLVLLGAFIPIYKMISNEGEEEICRLSIVQHALTKMWGKTAARIECPRNQIIFYDDRVEKNRAFVYVYENPSAKKKSKTYDSLNDYIVNQVLADELRDWWILTGKGKLDIFNENWISYMSWDNKNQVCLIASEIQFDTSTNKFKGLEKFLKDKPVSMSNTLVDDETKYFDFLASELYTGTTIGIPTNGVESFTDDYIPDSIDTEKTYAVFLRASKAPWVEDKIFGLDINTIRIAELSELIDLCDHIYN